MKLDVISTNNAPAAIGPYSQAVRAGDLLFCSGQIPLDPVTGEMIPGDVAAQTERVMANIAAVLVAAGTCFDNVVKTTIFLAEMGDFAAVNQVYARSFPNNKPARSTVAVRTLPRGALVEIEVIAQVH